MIEVLSIVPGASVADLGAGQGYFLPFLSSAVGPEGRVYAVEVEDEPLAALEARVSERGSRQRRDPAGPLRRSTASGPRDRSRADRQHLSPHRRPAGVLSPAEGKTSPKGDASPILDPDAELTGFFSVFLTEGHTSRAEDVREEMREAGYRLLESHDFLLTQIFEVFAPEPW